jgi:hypothetical protein
MIMIRKLNLPCWAAIAAMVLAPLPAAAQQVVTSPSGDPEVFCVSDGMMEASARGRVDQAAIGALVSGCRQRFGWSDNETRLGMLVGRTTIMMQLALADADQAHVERSVVTGVMESFTAEQIGGLQINFETLELNAGSQEVARQAAARFAERGVTGDAADKATRAVILALIAIRLAATFRSALRSGDLD